MKDYHAERLYMAETVKPKTHINLDYTSMIEVLEERIAYVKKEIDDKQIAVSKFVRQRKHKIAELQKNIDFWKKEQQQ